MRGLNVRISEIDVFGEEGTAKQAADYTTVLNVCLSRPNCVAYSTWGISDKYGSTTVYDSYPPIYGNDLFWDSAFNPKPAYQQVSKILKNER
jgi:endo-1,4-beta-xylanase